MQHTPTPDDSDRLAELIARCALRDQQAFLELYDATSAKLFAVSLRILKSETRAEDCLQEAYTKVWRFAGGYNAGRGRPMTWLINLARNQALDMLRSAASRRSWQEEELSDALQADDDPLADAEAQAELARLNQCLGRLSDDQRACVLRVYHEGYTAQEVAERQSWPLGTVKTWLRRSLIRLRECLDEVR